MNKNLNIQRNLNYKSINENIKINTKKKKKNSYLLFNFH